MVSAQAPGKLKFYRKRANGSMEFIYGNVVASLGPSGSSDGTIASTPEKWLMLPAFTAPDKVLAVNDQLVVTYEADAAVTVDASDCEFTIPITFADGSPSTLGSPDSTVDWDAKVAGDEAYVAGRETIFCIKTVRQRFALGGGKIFASVENNA